MKSNTERSFYFRQLAAWANGYARIIEEGRAHEFIREFRHDAEAHAAKLIDEAKLLLHSKKPNSEPSPQLQQTPCTTQLPPFPKDQLTFNCSIPELLAKVHDEMEGRFNLTAEDLFDVQSVLIACQ